MQRTAIYARVSTGRQVKEGESVQAQLKALHEYVESHDDLILVDEFVDEGISGQKAEERDELQRLLEYVKQDKIDLILFCKLDRFFRSMRYYVTTQELLDKHNVQWKTLWENHDTTTPQGRLIVSQMMSIAQFEAENTTQRIRAVFDYKVQKGEVLSGQQPPGFDIVDKRLVPNKDAEAIRITYETYASTGKQVEAKRVYEELTGRLVQCDHNFKQILRNEKYIGKFRDNPNYCPPIVPEDLFYAVQRLLDARETRLTKHDYILLGLVYCDECKHRMTSNRTVRHNKNGTDTVKVMYRCAASKRYHPTCVNTKQYTEHILEEYLLEHIKGEITYVYAQRTEIGNDKKRQENERKIRGIKEKLKRLKDLYVLGDYELDEYMQKKEELEDELKELEANRIETAQLTEYAEMVRIGDPKSIYKGLHTVAEKKMFWANILKKIWIDKERNIRIEL